jgi:hypothetical protein
MPFGWNGARLEVRFVRTRKIVKTLPHLLVWLGAAATFTTHPGTFPLTGNVVDADGRPVAGAVVERCEAGEGLTGCWWEMESRERTTTDVAGAFQLRATRTCVTLLVRKPGLARAWQQFMATPGAKTHLTLTPPTVLAGVVMDEADRPVAGAHVSVTMAYSETTREGGGWTYHFLSSRPARECFSVRTSPDGRFRITDFPTNATAELAAVAPGRTRKASDEPQYYGYYGPGTLPFRAGQEDIRLVMEPAGSIEGKIVAEPGGPPLPKARLTFQPDGPVVYGPVAFSLMQRGPVEAEADGSFRIADVPPGSYRLHVTFGTNAVPNWVAAAVPVSVESGQATGGVEIPARRGGLLAVTVLSSADRKPLADVSVTVLGEGSQTTANSSSNGIILLRLLPGVYSVAASSDDRRREEFMTGVVAGETSEAEIEVAPPPKISGVVRRPDGQPAAGLEVQVVRGGGGNLLGTQDVTDTDGRFEGQWNLPGYVAMEQRLSDCLLIRDMERNLAVAVDIDEDTGPLDLRLTSALTLVGRAECGGKPVTNASAVLIFWTGDGGMHLSGLSVAANKPGRFEIPALPPGRRYGVVVSAPGYGPKSLPDLKISAGPGRQELEPVELKPANLQIAGQVVDADDKPVAGVRVNLQGEDQPTSFTRTDREGRFRFAQVCEGPAYLHARARNSRLHFTTAGGETDVVL